MHREPSRLREWYHNNILDRSVCAPLMSVSMTTLSSWLQLPGSALRSRTPYGYREPAGQGGAASFTHSRLFTTFKNNEIRSAAIWTQIPIAMTCHRRSSRIAVTFREFGRKLHYPVPMISIALQIGRQFRYASGKHLIRITTTYYALRYCVTVRPPIVMAARARTGGAQLQMHMWTLDRS